MKTQHQHIIAATLGIFLGLCGQADADENEIKIDPQALPGPVVQAVMKAHPNATIKEAEKRIKPDGTAIGYEVEILEGGQEWELELDANGQILKTERD